MTTDIQPRQAKGQPVGGQFAAKANAGDDVPPLGAEAAPIADHQFRTMLRNMSADEQRYMLHVFYGAMEDATSRLVDTQNNGEDLYETDEEYAQVLHEVEEDIRDFHVQINGLTKPPHELRSARRDRLMNNWHKANKELEDNSVLSAADIAAEIHPAAAYLELIPSDQGAYNNAGHLADASGDHLFAVDISDAAYGADGYTDEQCAAAEELDMMVSDLRDHGDWERFIVARTNPTSNWTSRYLDLAAIRAELGGSR